MPFKPMPQLRLPPDDAVIWRYMDLWKLKAILTQCSLFFVRSDKFEDDWDSVLPPNWESSVNIPMGPRPDGGTYTIAEWYKEREIPSNPIVCWNCNDTECFRMWEEYTTGSESVVVKSTLGQLKQCFSHTEREIRIGLIEYGDHNDLASPRFAYSQWGDSSDTVPPNPWYVPRWFKRPHFQYEKELRATTHVSQREHPFDTGFNVVIGNPGVADLIQTIRLHPRASSAFAEAVRKLLSDTGHSDISVQPSSLAEHERG